MHLQDKYNSFVFQQSLDMQKCVHNFTVSTLPLSTDY